VTAPPAYDGHEQDGAAYALMNDGQYAAALPFAQNAVRALAGLGPKDPYEGFANFNLGKILVNLDRCDEALPFLERARTLEPKSKTVARAIKRAHACSRAPK
jgi:tetratricopeptide (TPR) repeat protein